MVARHTAGDSAPNAKRPPGCGRCLGESGSNRLTTASTHVTLGGLMHRRTFIATGLAATLASACWPSEAHAANRKFVFKIKTKSGGIIGNIVIEAKDMFAAIAKLKKMLGINITVIESRETALGNLILCNDKGCLISPTLQKFKKQISDCLGCEVAFGTLAEFNLVGSAAIASNLGCLCHRAASEEEIKKVEEILKVKTDIGTVAYGTPYIKAGVIVNSRGIIISDTSTGPELGRVDEVFNPER